MAAAANKADIVHILLEHIEDGAYENYIIEDDSFLQWVSKNTNGGGLYNRVTFTDRPIGGVGWSFGAAQASKMASGGDDWQVDWKDLFSLVSITHKAYAYNRHSVDRTVSMVKTELDSAAERFRTYLGFALWGNGSGMLAEIGTLNLATSIDITAATRSGLFPIQPNTRLEVSTDNGSGGAGVIANDVVRVTDVNRAGASRRILGPFGAAWSAGRFIFPQDGYNNVVQGVRAWMPLTAPSDTFNAVVRTDHPYRYGVIFDPTGLTITNFAEYLVWMATIYFEENPSARAGDLAFWMHPRCVAHLTNTLGVKLRYDASEIATNGSGKEATGRKGNPITVPKLFLPTEHGEIPIMMHRDITYGDVNLLNRSSMFLQSMGALFGPMDFDDADDKWIPHTAENAFECRMGGYPNLIVPTPHKNCVGNALSGGFLPPAT